MADGEGDDPELAAKRQEAEALAKLHGMSIERVIQAGHEASLRFLVAKVAAGTIKHQELAILRNMLRDNGMTMSVGSVLDLEASKQPLQLPPEEIPEALPAPNYNEE